MVVLPLLVHVKGSTKTFLFQAIQFSQTVLNQTSQFSKNIVFVYTQLNVGTVQVQTIQLNASTVSMLKQFYFQQFSLT